MQAGSFPSPTPIFVSHTVQVCNIFCEILGARAAANELTMG